MAGICRDKFTLLAFSSSVKVFFRICEYRFLLEMPMKGDVTRRINALLEEKGIKSSALCQAIGVNTSTLSTWRKRGTDPDIYLLSRICEFLGTSYSYLIEGNPSQEEILTGPERDLLEAFREIPDDSREKFMTAFKATLQIYSLGREDERKAEKSPPHNEDPDQADPEELLQAK